MTDKKATDGEVVDGDAVLDPAVAYIVTDILSDERARQAAFGVNNPLVLSRPAAAKTGTTSDYRDNWTMGYTRYLVAGVWAGNSDGHPMQSASGVTGAAPIWHDFMEGVLSQPDLLARLEAPTDDAAWQFEAPGGVERVDRCPPTLSCRAGGELFRTTWLDAMAEAGPLGDDVAEVPSAAVYVQQGDQARLAGYCGLPDGAARTMLLLPGMGKRGRAAPGAEPTAEPTPLPQYFEVNTDAQNGDSQTGETQTGDAENAANATEAEAPAMTLAQRQVVAWALRHGEPVYLGPCDQLQTVVPGALAMGADGENAQEGDLRVMVDLAAAGDPNAVTLSPDGAVPAEAIQRAVAVEGLTGAASVAQGIVHDSACPGNYVMGTVVNGAGAPMAGVRLMMTDAWGNQSFAESKSGQFDYGMFDFPIYGDGPQNLQLVVVDSNNNPRGAPVLVPHRMDVASDAPCHHVTIRGD